MAMTDKEKQEMVQLVEQALSPRLQRIENVLAALPQAKKMAAEAITPQDRKYLEERGWAEVFDDPTGLQRAGWLDMRPPPDQLVKMGEIIDPKTKVKIRDINQVLCSGSIATWHSVQDALAAEKKRNRNPLPPFELAELTGNPPKDDKFCPIDLQKWGVRDRQRRMVAGPFKEKVDAEKALTQLQSA